MTFFEGINKVVELSKALLMLLFWSFMIVIIIAFLKCVWAE